MDVPSPLPGPPQQACSNLCRVVKLGGAAITRKEQLETLDEETLEACARQVAAAWRQGLTVVVHGAGSFGHQHAARSGVARGGLAHSAAVRQGFAETRAAVTRLNHHVVAALLRAGVPAVGLSPCGTWRTRRRRVVADGCAAVTALLAAGLLPVLHGDAVLDDELGCTILSGDTILTRLCEVFRPPLAVFLTNVAGIYDLPPEQLGAQRIARLECSSDGSVLAAESSTGVTLAGVVTSTAEHDTTGGVGGKIREAAAALAACGPGGAVRIALAGSSAAAAALQLGPLPPDWGGTTVVLAEPQ